MSAPVVTTLAPKAAVVGDGTSARTRASRRWRRWRFPLAIVGLFCVVGLLAALPEPRTSTLTLAPDNAQPTGARAAAQILGAQGVDVHFVRRIADVAALDGDDATILVIGDALLDPDKVAVLADADADLVMVDAEWVLGDLTDAIVTVGSPGPADVRSAQCADPDAVAAGTITASGALRAVGPDATACFPADGAPDAGGAYAVTDTGTHRVTVLADPAPLTNLRLADEGNAALVLRMLGRHERLVWYIPSLDDTGSASGGSGPSSTDVLPPVVPILALQLLLVAAVAALWRGRRLGRVVTEQMPVVVRAGETTRGRGRLYRRARSYGHAAAALRAGATARSCARLGLPRSAGAEVVIDALARSSSRSPQQIEALLYGPPPTDDIGLAQLARDLDHLESEVHRS